MISIYYQLQNQLEKRFSFDTFIQSFQQEGYKNLVLIFCLMLVNWGIEAKKWQISLSPLTTISFKQAYKAVFSGTTVAFFTPNRIGEYLGRMLYVKNEHRLQSIPLTILGSVSQLTITLFLGCISLFYWKYNSQYQPISINVLNTLLWVSILLCIIMLVFYLRTQWLFQKILKLSWTKKAYPYFKALLAVDKKIMISLLSWSFLRYLVFISQYWLVMDLFGIKLSVVEVMGVMATIFFLLAIIPTFGELMDMGVRLKTGVYMLQNISGNVVGMMASSLTIWIVNLVIPALIGSLLILTIRIFNDRKKI